MGLTKPLIIISAQGGMAIPRFTGSCVVGVTECGSGPSRLAKPINRMSKRSIRVQFCP